MEWYWVREPSVEAITRRASAGDSPHDGGGSIRLSPRETRRTGHPSRLSPKPPRPSELGEQLRPDREHSDEQRQRREGCGLFHENLQHARLHQPEHMWNIVPFLFWRSRRKNAPQLAALTDRCRARSGCAAR